MNHPGLERHSGVVMRVHVQRVLAVGTEVFIAPLEVADDFPAIRVEQQFVRIEAVAPVRPPEAMGSQAVNQSRRCVGQVAMPDIVGVGGQHQAADFNRAGIVKQAQRHGLRVG